MLDAALTALKYAELLIELKKRFNWSQNKAYGYESPLNEEIMNWKLEEQYDVKALDS